MKFFKNKKQSGLASVQTAPAIVKNDYPFKILEKSTACSNSELELYKVLKEAVPIIDAAISKILRLTGEFKIICDDEYVQEKINKFISDVQVGACGKGVNNFVLSHLNQLLTYGTAVGEIVLDEFGENISALYSASLSDVELKTDNNPLDLKIYRRKSNGETELIKYPELVLISTLNPEPGHIYGDSIMKGLPFVSNILLKIYNSIGINWERLGNIRFAVTYKPPQDAGERAYSKERAHQIATEWSKTMHSGPCPSDFIAVGDVSIKVIGADNQILDSQIPVRQMLEQIISKLSIPPFLLGLNWSTTETMSTQQAEILSSELEAYRRILNPIIRKICDMWMQLNGMYEKYEIVWEKIDLKDGVQLANARLLNAQAEEIEKRISVI